MFKKLIKAKLLVTLAPIVLDLVATALDKRKQKKEDEKEINRPAK